MRLAFATLMLAGAVASAAPDTRSVASTGAIVGQPAPDFVLKTLAGQNLRLSESLGQVVMINFWASWCGPCRQEMPALEKLYSTYRSAGLVLLGVSVDEDIQRAGEFARTLRISYPVLLDHSKAVAPLYDLQALPMSVLIDRAGVVRYVHYDYKPGFEQRYVEELRTLLDE